MNSLIRDHLPATYFEEYQSLRPSLLEALVDDDLGLRLGGKTITLGGLCREMGEIEYSYLESLRSFRLDFSYRHPDDSVATSMAALTSWYSQLDQDLESAIVDLTEDDIANRRILRDLEGDGFAPLPPSSWTSTAKRYSSSTQKRVSIFGNSRNHSRTAGRRGSAELARR